MPRSNLIVFGLFQPTHFLIWLLFPTIFVSGVLVKDGTYLTTDSLRLDKSAPVANVHLMLGGMRDDGASFPQYPTTTNLSLEISKLTVALPTSEVLASGAFPLPSGPNSTLNVFNVKAHLFSDSTFRCLDAATAYAEFKNKLFKLDIYYYEFNGSYQSATWDPNAPVCHPPLTPSKLLGDPELEYFKCHSGELYYVFGTIQRTGLPLRDEHELPFEQFAVDSRTSFARTYNPNPDGGFLEARGYANSSLEMKIAGKWRPISGEGLTMRQLQWSSYQTEWPEQKQCEVLGLPLDYFF